MGEAVCSSHPDVALIESHATNIVVGNTGDIMQLRMFHLAACQGNNTRTPVPIGMIGNPLVRRPVRECVQSLMGADPQAPTGPEGQALDAAGDWSGPRGESSGRSVARVLLTKRTFVP